MQSAMDTQALPVPTLAGTKHDRSTEGDAVEPVAKRRLAVDEAISEYKDACERNQQHKAQRVELERQKAEIEAKLAALPTKLDWNYHSLGVYERAIRRAYRAANEVWVTHQQYDKQTCPWCKHTPKRRSFNAFQACKNCNQVYHTCFGRDYDTKLHAMCAGKPEDCLGCRKPLP